jgi:pimeloyl-ACP methyl ester carboxylesterase
MRGQPRWIGLAVLVGASGLALGSVASSRAGAQAVSAPVKHASVNGVDLGYVDQGQGAPVVFVHGAFSDHRAWEGQREPVSRWYRYVAPTQRYFGTDPWPDAGEKYSLQTHADDLAAFIRELKAGPVSVVGWSYGGAIALTLTVQHPELVKSLFLHEPAIATFVTDAADAKAAGEDRRDMATPAANASKAGDNAVAVRLFFDGVNGQPGFFDALAPESRAMFLENARTIPLLLAAPPPPGISCADLGQIKVPVAVAKGELTRSFYRIVADTASRCIPGSRLVVILGGRHAAPALTPAAFNEALLGFLRDS